jgi:hypothetical protein
VVEEDAEGVFFGWVFSGGIGCGGGWFGFWRVWRVVLFVFFATGYGAAERSLLVHGCSDGWG